MKRWLLRLLVASTAFTASLAFAANVVVFTDTNYVEYDPGNSDAEASNVVDSLTTLGHTASTFTGSSTAAWSLALSGKKILILPEFENGAPDGLDAGVATVVQNFVNGGGHLIVMADSEGVLARLLGWAPFTDMRGSPATATPQKAGSIFAAGPASLPEMNGSNAPLTSELPASTTCAYAFIDTSEYCSVFTRTQGSGRVNYFAWDWFFDSSEADDRPIWENMLNLAIAAAPSNGGATTPVAVPTTSHAVLVALSGLMMLGGIAMRRRRNR